MRTSITDEQPRVYFDCDKCPAYCCSIYERVQVTKRDLNRLARYFGTSVETATRRYTRVFAKERILRRKKDKIFGKACEFLNEETRKCTIYHARPSVCREYPDRKRCAYYDLITFERKQQDDEDVVPLVQITFRKIEKKELNGNS